MSYVKKQLEEMLESLSKSPDVTLTEMAERYRDLEKELQDHTKHPVYVYRCKMCGEIFHTPAVGIDMLGDKLMVLKGWEEPPSKYPHECKIQGFSYLSYEGGEPLTPLVGRGEFVGYGYITDVKEDKDDLDN